jgi:hypothetical protein
MNFLAGAAIVAGYAFAALFAYTAEKRYRSKRVGELCRASKFGTLWGLTEYLVPMGYEWAGGGFHGESVPPNCLHKPNRVITRWIIEPGGQITHECQFRLNNRGQFSARDMSPEKTSDEFRIVVLGGREAGSDLVDVCWPDHLHRLLTERTGRAGKRITVLNFGTPLFSGFDLFPSLWRRMVKEANPDFLIVSLAQYYFHVGLRPSTSPTTLRGWPVHGFFQKYTSGRGEHLWLHCVGSEDNLASLYATAVPPFMAFLPPSLAHCQEEVSKMQQAIVEDLLRSKLSADWRPWRAIERFGGEINLSGLIGFDPPRAVVAPPNVDEMADHAAIHLGELIAELPSCLLITVPEPGGWNRSDPSYQIPDILRARDSRLDITDIHAMLVIDKDQYAKWFIPSSRELSSDGHRGYAEAIVPLVEARIAKFL